MLRWSGRYVATELFAFSTLSRLADDMRRFRAAVLHGYWQGRSSARASYRTASAIAKRVLHALGRRQTPIAAELLTPWFQAYGIRSIIDVGANEGQFASWARAAFPQAHIVSFEPLPECIAALRRTFAGDTRFEAFDVALGAAPADVEIFRNEFTPSSSLLHLDAGHKAAFPFASNTTTVKVRMRTLDDVLSERELPEPVFLKLDVQGYEAQVLAGGPRTLARSRVVMLEMSLERLYQDEPLFDDIYRLMYASGFALRGIVDMLRRPADRRPLQVDALFERRA